MALSVEYETPEEFKKRIYLRDRAYFESRSSQNTLLKAALGVKVALGVGGYLSGAGVLSAGDNEINDADGFGKGRNQQARSRGSIYPNQMGQVQAPPMHDSFFSQSEGYAYLNYYDPANYDRRLRNYAQKTIKLCQTLEDGNGGLRGGLNQRDPATMRPTTPEQIRRERERKDLSGGGAGRTEVPLSIRAKSAFLGSLEAVLRKKLKLIGPHALHVVQNISIRVDSQREAAATGNIDSLDFRETAVDLQNIFEAVGDPMQVQLGHCPCSVVLEQNDFSTASWL